MENKKENLQNCMSDNLKEIICELQNKNELLKNENLILKKELNNRQVENLNLTSEIQKECEYYRLLVNNSFDALVVFKNNQLIFSSPAFKDMFVMQKIEQDKLQAPFFEIVRYFIHPEDFSFIIKALKKSEVEKEEISRYTFRAKHLTKEYIWVEMLVKRLKNSNKTIVNFHDISSLKKIEKTIGKQYEQIKSQNLRQVKYSKKLQSFATELESKNQNLSAIFNSAIEGYIILNTDLQIIDANTKAEQLYKYEGSILKNISPYRLIERNDMKNFRLFTEELKSKDTAYFQGKHLTKDKKIFFAECYGNNITYNDERHILLIIRDISDRVKTQEALKHETQVNKILAKIGEEIIGSKLSIDKISQNICLQAQKITCSKNGVISIFDINKNAWQKNKTDEFTEILEEKSKELLSLEENISEPIVSNNLKNDYPNLNFSEINTPIKNFFIMPAFANSQLVGQIALVNKNENYNKQDVETMKRFANIYALAILRKRTENELKTAKQKAEYADKLKTEFIANMSHEIRTPMNTILGFAEILREELSSDPILKDYIRLIEISGRNLLMLINDILDLSKIEAGKLDIQKESIDIKNLIREIQQIFAALCNKKRLKFIVEISDKFPQILLTDGVRLRQILFNLVGNAVKYTHQGFVKLKIIETKIIKNRVSFSVIIEDTGIGISSEEKEKIFEPFHNSKNPKARKSESTGLGLTITRRLVKLMDGNIDLKSKVDEGTIFTINFFDVKICTPIQNKKLSKVLETKPKFEKSNILLISCLDDYKKLLSINLKDTNLTLEQLTIKENLNDLLQKTHFSLVIFDIDSYKKEEKYIYNTIKEYSSEIKIIAITSNKEKNEKFIKLDEIILKPLSKDELFLVLKKLLPHKEEVKNNKEDSLENNNVFFKLAQKIRGNELNENLVKWIFEKENECVFFIKHLPVDDIENFAVEIDEIAGRYQQEELSIFAFLLKKSSETFDITTLLKLLGTFLDLISVLKNNDVEQDKILK